MTTLYSIENSYYQRWQAELLGYSFQKVKQHGKLVQLLSSPIRKIQPQNPIVGEIIQVGYHRFHSNDDDYPVYNKILGLKNYLKNHLEQDGPLLLLDPDMIFLKPFTFLPNTGPLAHFCGYLPKRGYEDEIIRQFTAKPVDPISFPIIIYSHDLELIMDRWLELTIKIRQQYKNTNVNGVNLWTADMYAYNIASTEFNLQYTPLDMCREEVSDKESTIFAHYARPFSVNGNTFWDKRTYRSWEPVECLENATPTMKAVLGFINDYRIIVQSLIIPT